MKWLTWLLFVTYVLQSDVLIFLRGAAPVAAAFHPVMALVDFALGVLLALRALPLPRQVEAPAGLRHDLERPQTVSLVAAYGARHSRWTRPRS